MRCLAFICLFSIASYSQVDSLAEALKYYPLQTGDYWEYLHSEVQMPFPGEYWYESLTITGDTVLSNNKLYKILSFKRIPPDSLKRLSFYQRVDSLTACVYEYYDDSVFINKDL